MILNREDSIYAANIFVSYFKDFGRIDDYLRKVKLERMSKYPTALPGMGPEDEFFCDFDMLPNDMEFSLYEPKTSDFVNYLEITTSHAVESSIPGKKHLWIVKEKNTNKIVGFIRFGSPTINSKPRNLFLGKPLDTLNADVMKRFNDSCIMGFIIVPTQPFGFNYLGGKLLAGICCSHLARETLNKKYDANICMFETTSLYGSAKTTSMYDGMKPMLKFVGLTESDFVPLINDDNYLKLNDWFKDRNNGDGLVPDDASSRKLKTQSKMISIIKTSLKEIDMKLYDKFCEVISEAKNLTQRKRQYMCTYGFDNVKEYFNLETDTLTKRNNYDRFEFDNIVEWWRKKAINRYENLQKDGRLRTELETWNQKNDIDIIR
jgi:hypothetical protein